jgi:hypothetical protein
VPEKEAWERTELYKYVHYGKLPPQEFLGKTAINNTEINTQVHI